jgi:hypothetical protein
MSIGGKQSGIEITKALPPGCRDRDLISNQRHIGGTYTPYPPILTPR